MFFFQEISTIHRLLYKNTKCNAFLAKATDYKLLKLTTKGKLRSEKILPITSAPFTQIMVQIGVLDHQNMQYDLTPCEEQ